MPSSAGPQMSGIDNLVFTYDIGDTSNSYLGEPTTNYWDGVQYSIYNDNATNYRNQTFPPPPSPGYEVVKVVSNTLGTYGQSILWKAPYPNNDVATITNSIYAYLVEGSYVQVGQHWWPWYYGTQKAIPKNQWVRISETYSINEGNSYGVAALTYSTDGTAYFSMPQFEYKTHVTPFVGANSTRTANQSLFNLIGDTPVNMSSVSFNSQAQPYFDGTDDFMPLPTGLLNGTGDFTVEAVIQAGAGGVGGTVFGNYPSGNLQIFFGQRFIGMWLDNASTYLGTSPWSTTLPEFTTSPVHIVAARSGTITSFYINGILKKTGSSTANIGDTSAIFRAGTNTNTTEQFIGDIFILKAYNLALTTAEIQNNYQNYKTRFNLS